MTTVEHSEPAWTLGEKIAKARKLAGLSQIGLASAVGVSASLVSKWESDTREPRLSQIRTIEAVCPVPPDWLVRSRCSVPKRLIRHMPRSAKRTALRGLSATA